MDPTERRLKVINELELAPKGSLWFVQDCVWKQVIEKFVVKRKGHVALVFKQMTFASLNDTVPVLIGTSHGHGLKLRPVLPPNKKSQHTIFSAVRPICTLPNVSSPLAIDNFTGDNETIKRNPYKKSIDEDEFFKLDCYLANKGLNI